jgi:nucleotide-binding universal stress UspA family protein
MTRVLVAFDFGSAAQCALWWATAFQRARLGDTLLAVHVVKPVIVGDRVAMPSLTDPGDLHDLEDKVRAAVTAFDATAWVRIVVGRNVADEILSLAQSLRASLIVIGSHARPRTARYLLGSVSDAVVRGAHCPVLVVHDTDRATS